jgi:hypothetical protein
MSKRTALEKFCDLHHACPEGREWAIGAGCKTPAEAWAKCECADWMIWMLRQVKLLDKPQWVRVAVEMATDVLDIYERRYPDNPAPRKAIEAARKWLDEPNEENRKAAYAAAASAYAASDSAAASAAAYDAAYAAADAAAADAADAADAAAAAAAYAAAYAASAASAADAADAAYADAADARQKQRQKQADMLRRVLGNPFEVWP